MTEQERTGSIIRIIGPVLDVRFKEGSEPPIKTLLVTKTEPPVHIEVVQHHSPGVVRAIALEPTEGLSCGIAVSNTGGGIHVPVGENVLGRVIDCLGRPIDGLGPIDAPQRDVHQAPPSFMLQRPSTTLFETGIKVIDLLAP